MPVWIANIKKRLERYIHVTAASFSFDAATLWRHVCESLKKSRVSLRRVGLKVWIWFCGVIRKIDETPIIVKMQLALLTIILFFIFWQFIAYEMSQTTFISVNIIMAVCLTSVSSIISIRSQKGIEEFRKMNNELKVDLEQRDAELDRLKNDLFELRNKNRRQNAIEKGSVRFVETVRKMKAQAAPDAEPLQYLIDAIGVCFDITGAVAFMRKDDEAGGGNVCRPDAQAEAGQDDAHGLFTLAGRFGLSDEPPTEVFSAGDGILGQVVVSDKTLTLEKVPADYLTALSGLGRSRNINVYVLPLTKAETGRVEAVIEVASFEKLKIVDAWEAIEQQLRDVI